LPGFAYKLTTFGVTGYQDASAPVTVSSVGTNLIRGIQIELKRNEAPTAPELLAQSNLDAAGSPVPSGRSIRFLFARQVDFNFDSLKGLGSHQVLGVIAKDDDRDNVLTATKLKVETVAKTDLSKLVKVESDDRSITVTFSEDSNIIDGTIDAEDDLAYSISAAFFDAIKVRDRLSASQTGWTSMNALRPTAVFVVRSTHP
jgi:hypothetical protein